MVFKQKNQQMKQINNKINNLNLEEVQDIKYSGLNIDSKLN